MKDKGATIQSDLVDYEAELVREYEEAKALAARLKRKIACVRRAIRDLEDEESDSPSQDLVRELMRGLLGDGKQTIPAKRLEAMLTKQLQRDHDLTAKGLALRIKEVLAGDEFVATEEGVRRVAQPNRSPTSKPNQTPPGPAHPAIT